MNPVEADTLRLLSHMPLIDRLEAVAVSGWSRGAVYDAVESLERGGLAASVPHASELTAATRRYCLTADGLRRMARQEDRTLDELLRSRPVSNQWLRVLMERLDAVGVVYRLVSAISTLAHPLRFRWYRAMPIDAAVALPDGRVIAVVRQGPATPHRLLQAALAAQGGAAARRRAPADARRGAAAPRPKTAGGSAVHRLPSPGEGRRLRRRGSAHLAHALRGRPRRSSHGPRPHRAARTLARRGAARAGVPSRRPRRGRRGGLDAAGDAQAGGEARPRPDRRLALAHLRPPRRSHGAEAVEALRDRRTAEVLPPRSGTRNRRPPPSRRHRPRAGDACPQGPRLGWGRQEPVERGPHHRRPAAHMAQRRRQAQQAASQEHRAHRRRPRLHRGPGEAGPPRSREVVQLDPPRRASRYFRHADRLRSIHPDAFGVLRRGDAIWPFFLEWERRAVRPVTMAARLAPYLRYYSSHRPTDDHGARPDVLVVFHDDLAATHFLRIAREETARSGVDLPLLVSHRGLVEREGPLGRAWLTPGVTEPTRAFTTGRRELEQHIEGGRA